MIVCNCQLFVAWYRAFICTFIFSSSESSLPFFVPPFDLRILGRFYQNNIYSITFLSAMPAASMMIFLLLYLVCDAIQDHRYISSYILIDDRQVFRLLGCLNRIKERIDWFPGWYDWKWTSQIDLLFCFILVLGCNICYPWKIQSLLSLYG
jgi:hypothetical protein